MSKVTIKPDHRTCLYKLGQTARVSIQCAGSTVVTVHHGRLRNQSSLRLSAGHHVLSFVASEPDFLRLEAGKGADHVLCGLGFEPSAFDFGFEEPKDFDAFWSAARAEASRVPLDPRLEELPEHSTDGYTAYAVSFANVFQTRMYGYLTIPKGRGPYPICCSVPGAGPGFMSPLLMYNDRVITLAMNVFPFKMPGNHAEAKRLLHETYPHRYTYWYLYSQRLEDVFFYRAILGMDRAFDYVAGLPEADGRHMVYVGTSQGGAMGIVMGALNRHVTALALNVPSDFRKIFVRSYAEEKNPLIDHIGYFSGDNFARRVRIPVHSSCGLVDVVCPPVDVTSCFNHLSGPKRMFYIPGMGHSFDEGYERKRMRFIREQLRCD